MDKYRFVENISKKADGSRVDLMLSPYSLGYFILAIIPVINLDDGAHLLKSLIGHSSPFIAQVYDVFLKDEKVYIMEEYVRGRTLGSLLREKRKIKEKKWKEWELELRAGLGYLHNMKPGPLYHGDVHPDNIIIDFSNRTKLIDFSSIKSDNRPTGRKIHAVRAFLDPRILHGFPYDKEADLYSLKKVIELLSI